MARAEWPDLLNSEMATPKLLLPSTSDVLATFKDAISKGDVDLARPIYDKLKVRDIVIAPVVV